MRKGRVFPWMIIWVLMCFLFHIEVNAAEKYPYTTPVNMQTIENAKIYMYDSEDSAIISVIPKDSYVLVIGATDNGYYVVNLGGAAGFIPATQVLNLQDEEIEQVDAFQSLESDINVIYHNNQTYTIYQTDYSGEVEEQYRHLIIESGFSKSEKITAKRMYDYLPEYMETYLTKHQLVCIYTKDEQKYDCVPEEASGYTMATYISAPGEDGFLLVGNITCYAKNPDSILHEIGHAVDQTICEKYTATQMSQQQRFVEIYNAEAAKSGLRRYYISHEEEYFAECFRLYLVDEQLLKEKMPQTCMFMQELIESMK